MKTNRVYHSAGFTLVEIMIVVSLIGLLCSIAIPSMTKARANAQKRVCLSNLRVIDAAKEEWAFEYKKSVGSRARKSQINAFIGRGAPKCPAGGRYRYHPLDTFPSCDIDSHNIFADYGVDDDEE